MGPLRRRRTDDQGAALVEFALVMPLLVLILFGIIEFGFAYGQHLGVRHGARETARLAAVNYQPTTATGTDQTEEIIETACQRMDLATAVTADLAWVGSSPDPQARGGFFVTTVSAPVEQITGLFSFALDGVTLESEVESRIETNVTWDPHVWSCP